ncbi:hypothetical protein ABID21_000448 [Pseudorhizobium tarimense]|uniref:Uncharacterized protein n=1 Tax=Pseudorhizobium tarimense TaxID=1079109 RepID=A0ABV2H1E9_9HYPH|nr:hypothetical protein [Pseudorhizobium tarimense]MCJ8517665.1 hypothetical protein [Pseudorhizobium tarimense]
MTNHHADGAIVSEIETVRLALPTWVISTVELVELAENAERAARDVNPETADRSRKLIVEVAEWQQRLHDWQSQDLSPRLLAELRILKATLDAAMDEANAAAAKLRLFD